ncbi:MAG: FecR family protein [Draconibacterium sp.]|nr:FecR family protein [Draconibacterium sp.]
MRKTYIDTDDFLISENFNEYILGNSRKQQEKWDAYFKQFPDTKPAADNARKIIMGIDSMEDRISQKEVPDTKLHNQFEKTWNKYKGEKSKTVILRISKIMWRSISVAAVLVFAFLFYSVLNNFIADRNSTPEYFEVYVPPAKQSQLTLPDGTTVWVNCETKIKYSNQFNLKERNIYLSGEAYFEVSKNKDLPFCVFSNGVEVKVLGTKFNVKGYANEKTVETILVEGKVELSRVGDKSGRSIELYPGDKATLNLNTSKVVVSRENIVDDIAWKDGKIIFRNTALHEVCKALSRRYNAEIVLGGDTKSLHRHPFTFTIENETLPLILDYLCRAAPLIYNVEYIDLDGKKGIEKVKYFFVWRNAKRRTHQH